MHSALKQQRIPWTDAADAAETTEYPRDLAEVALAHALRDKTEAAYRRGDGLAMRRKMMENYGAFCTTAN